MSTSGDAGGVPADDGAAPLEVWLEPWDVEDLPVLEAANTPGMTRFLNGPETAEQLTARHAKYLRFWQTGEASMYRVVIRQGPGPPVPAGSIGFWGTDAGGDAAYEAGWAILEPFQGRGVARRALDDCLRCAAEYGDRDRRWLLAYPSVDNAASNALCRRAGFERRGEVPREFRGRPLRTVEWAFDLDRLR